MNNKWKIKIGEKVYKSEQLETVRRLIQKIKNEKKFSDNIQVMRPGQREWKDAREIEEFEDMFLMDNLTLEDEDASEEEKKEPRDGSQDGKCSKCGSVNPPDSAYCDFCKLPFTKKRESAQPDPDVNDSSFSEEEDENNDFSITDVLKFSFNKIKERPLFFAAVMLFAAVFSYMLDFLFFVSIILGPFFTIGFLNIFIITSRGGRASFSDFLSKIHLIINMIGLYFISGGVTFMFLAVVFIIFRNYVGGARTVEDLIRFHTTGIIIISLVVGYFYMRFFFAQIALVDREYGPIEALTYSWSITHRSELKLLIIMILMPLLLTGVLALLVYLFSSIVSPGAGNYIWVFGMMYVVCFSTTSYTFLYVKLEGG